MAFIPWARTQNTPPEKGLHVAKHCLPIRQNVATLWLKYGVGLEKRSDPG